MAKVATGKTFGDDSRNPEFRLLCRIRNTECPLTRRLHSFDVPWASRTELIGGVLVEFPFNVSCEFRGCYGQQLTEI